MSESTPLWTAVRSFSEPDSPAIVKALLEAGADPSGRGFWSRPNEEDKKRLMSWYAHVCVIVCLGACVDVCG